MGRSLTSGKKGTYFAHLTERILTEAAMCDQGVIHAEPFPVSDVGLACLFPRVSCHPINEAAIETVILCEQNF